MIPDFTENPIRFDTEAVRRQDRVMDLEQTLQLLKRGEYGILCLSSDNVPYGVPISYVFENGKIYFHCAVDGEKIEIIAQNPKACFTVVGQTRMLPEKFATAYESVMAFGILSEVSDMDEKTSAFFSILKKYSPAYMEEGKKYMKSVFNRAKVFRLEIEEVSGKTRREGLDQ